MRRSGGELGRARGARRIARPLAIALAVLWASVAFAQLSNRRVGVAWRDGAPHLSFSARDLATRDVRRELESGLRKQILVTVQAFRSGSRAPIAQRQLGCSVTYDLWEDTFIVRLGRETELYPDLDQVLSRCLAVRHLRVGTKEDYERFRGQEIYFAVRAEFNPISDRRCRQLLRSNRSQDPIGPIVINIVRREICAAEHAVEFQCPQEHVP